MNTEKQIDALARPEVVYEVEREDGERWCNGVAYPVFKVVARCANRKAARDAAEAFAADRPSLIIRVVKRTPKIITIISPGKSIAKKLKRALLKRPTNRRQS